MEPPWTIKGRVIRLGKGAALSIDLNYKLANLIAPALKLGTPQLSQAPGLK
jgi:hypothetical protein